MHRLKNLQSRDHVLFLDACGRLQRRFHRIRSHCEIIRRWIRLRSFLDKPVKRRVAGRGNLASRGLRRISLRSVSECRRAQFLRPRPDAGFHRIVAQHQRLACVPNPSQRNVDMRVFRIEVSYSNPLER